MTGVPVRGGEDAEPLVGRRCGDGGRGRSDAASRTTRDCLEPPAARKGPRRLIP